MPADRSIGAGARCSLTRRSQALLAGAGVDAERTWHVAVTNIGWEASVHRQLMQRGLSTLLPVIRKWRIRNRRRVPVETPLMPRYVLFGIDHGSQSLVIRRERYRMVDGMPQRIEGEADAEEVRGLERIVKDDRGSWARVPLATVYELRDRLLKGEFDPTLGPVSKHMWWLVERGILRLDEVVAHKAAEGLGLQFTLAA